MSRVFRLTTMKTWPIALSTEKGFVHFGLFGVSVVCTELSDDNPTPRVEVKKYNFCEDTGLMNDPLLPEIAKVFGLKMEDIAILNTYGHKSLNAEQMCESMKASCRLLSSLGNVIEFVGYPVIWQTSFASIYTQPVANMSELEVIDTNLSEHIPVAKAGETSIIREVRFKDSGDYSVYARKYENAIDLSLVPVGRGDGYYNWSVKDVTVDNMYSLLNDVSGDWNWDKGSVSYGNERHTFRFRKPQKNSYGEYTSPLFSGNGLEVAYTHCSPWCKMNGKRGAEKGMGRDLSIENSRGKVLKLTSQRVNGKQKWELNWENYYRSYGKEVPSLTLDNAWALVSYPSDIQKAFERVPSANKLARMIDIFKFNRYGKKEIDSDAVPSRGELGVIMHAIVSKVNPDDALLKGINARGFITNSEAETLLNDYVAQAIQNSRKADANIQMAAELCKSSAMLSDKGGAFSPSGEPIDVDGVKFVFYPVTFKGQSGCYPKLISISEKVLEEGAVISVPAVGDVVDAKGKTTQLPVVALTPEFCSDKAWRTAIRGIVLPASIVQLVGRAKSTEDGVFSGFHNLELLDMSACTGLKLIGECAILDCPHLHEINMPDIKAEEGYTIHERAFCDLPAVSSLKIRALDIVNGAFVNVSVYSLDVDAVSVKSNGFGRGVVVEGDITLGESFKEIGTSGMSGLCTGKDISVKLPNILTLANNALERNSASSECGGTIEIGDKITAMGSSALSGWANVIINAKEGGVAGGALNGIGSIKVHTNSPYDNEAIKSIQFDKITYFEGEEVSDYRKEAEAYLAMYSAFIAENGGTVQQFLDATEPEDAMCMELELPSLLSIIGNQTALNGAPKNYFAQHIVDGSLTFTNVLADKLHLADTIMWSDIAVLRTLMAIAVPVPINLINIYSNADLYARCEQYMTVHRSDNMIIERFLYETADFRTEFTMYSVTLKENGNTYLFMENGCGRKLSSKSEFCDYIGITSDDIDAVAYKSVPGFQLITSSTEAEDGSGDLLGESCNAPFLAPGDIIKSSVPTLLFESMAGKKDTFAKYMETIVASAVILNRKEGGYIIYQPTEKWKITIAPGTQKLKKDSSIRVDERQIAISLPTFCKELVALKGSAIKAITDPKVFATFAEQAIHPKSSASTNFDKVLKAFEDVKSKTPANALPLSKDLFDTITQYGSYIMSVHSGTGALASENNLTLSKETEQRRLMADGQYLQCFVAARVTKGKQLKKDDLTEGDRVAYRGGKGQIWYRIYDADKGGTPTATYVSSYGVQELLLHLKSFDFSKDGMLSAIHYGTLVDKNRFIFDSETMPTFFDSLVYFQGGEGSDAMKAKVGCALDRYTGHWYMVANNLGTEEEKGKDGRKKKKIVASNKIYVLFPISNIAFASAVMLGLSGTQSTSTRDYLIDLLDALRRGNGSSSAVCKYKEACSELAKDASEFSTDKPDRKRIMELTDFFLAPCLG